MMTISNQMMSRASLNGNQLLSSKNGSNASPNRGVGVVFSASNLQGADHFEKPALQFGNAYAEKRKAALAAQVARRQQDEWQDGLEKARREEEQLGEK
jgi:hypothetical protein